MVRELNDTEDTPDKEQFPSKNLERRNVHGPRGSEGCAPGKPHLNRNSQKKITHFPLERATCRNFFKRNLTTTTRVCMPILVPLQIEIIRTKTPNTDIKRRI